VNGERTEGERLTRHRLNAQEAAEVLGISVDALRMRARRGTLDSEHENGRLYVWLDVNETNVHHQGQVEALLQEKDERIAELREQTHHFREILAEERDARRRADTIIAQLTQANAALAALVPELEAPAQGRTQEPRETPETVEAEPEVGEPRSATGGPQEGTEPRSWWQRMFGG
jgi:hypothetical protein